MSQINRAVFAGRWYSDDPDRLNTDLDTFALSGAAAGEGDFPLSDAVPGTLQGAVLPHAGLSFSGRGIAHAFSADHIKGIQRVVVLAPSHYASLNLDTLYLERFDRHQTPLGELQGVPEFAERVRESLGPYGVVANETVEGEHATEMFLPFINRWIPDGKVSLVLVPAFTGTAVLDQWAKALRAALAQEKDSMDDPLDGVMIIMSSDFTHYGWRFGYTPSKELVREDDLAVANMIARGSRSALLDRMTKPITVCGRYPILLGMTLMGPVLEGTVVDYYDSREILGKGESDFVCYATILFPRGHS